MKKLLLALFIFLLCAAGVFAADITEESQDSEYVSMEVSVGLQSVFTNEIPIIVKFTPNTDSKKASIEWVLPYGLESDSDLKQWFAVEEGTEYEVKAWVRPEEVGTYSIPVNVDVWLYNSSHVNTKTLSFTIDDNLRVTPIPSEYVRNFVLKWVAIVLLSGIGLFLLWRLWLLVYPKFKKWLES
ncbi:MAG: hypothetical protein ABIC57_00800 [bacterium]